MWDCTRQPIVGGRGERHTPLRDGTPLAYGEVLRLWQHDEEFRGYFVSLLRGSPLLEFRWETPPITRRTADRRDFEFVLLDGRGLDRTPDADAFADQFSTSSTADESVVAFPNLGGDAVLVVPRAVGPHDAYGHLAAFVRQASPAQVHELWRVVGRTVEARLTERPLWLSTAGLGVAWLHVRLDERPKYYGFAEYRRV